MQEIALKYGCNPNQTPARIYMKDGSKLPLEVLNGRPGYINFLDALNAWQLVRELSDECGLVAAASFKHVSPTSAALAIPMSNALKSACFVDDIEGLDESAVAVAYARARGCDRLCSFGDWIALSDTCDETCAKLIKREVSDGIIAPEYTPKALSILKEKRKGAYNVVQINPDYEPASLESKEVFGITFEQGHNNVHIGEKLLENIVTKNQELPVSAKRDMLVALITLKYTQSNSVVYAVDGQAIGVGAGQQSRIHCTRLAGSKADMWFLRQHIKVLELPWKEKVPRPIKDNVVDAYLNKNEEDVLQDKVWQKYFLRQPEPFTDAEKRAWLDAQKSVVLASDAFFPFSDNIERAYKSGVKYVVQPGGSIRDDVVIQKCDDLEMVMVTNGVRLFHH